MAWGYHTTTGRVQRIDATPTRDRVGNDATWKRAIKWMAVDFGFGRCPILGQRSWPCRERKSFSLNSGAGQKTPRTILEASRRLCRKHPVAPDPAELIQPTERIEWMWIKKGNERHRSRKPIVSSPQSRQDFVRGDSRRFRMPNIECPRKKEVKQQGRESFPLPQYVPAGTPIFFVPRKLLAKAMVFVVRHTSRHHREHQKCVCEKDRKSGCRLPCNLRCGLQSSRGLGNLWSCCWTM